MHDSGYGRVRKVLWGVLWLNLLVAGAKLGYGMWMGSVSLTADGYHSLFDGTSNIIALIGLWVASHPADENHPYGHRKFETLATIGIGVMLTMACLHVLESAYERFQNPSTPTVSTMAYVVVIGTMAINLWVFLYESRAAGETNSEVLHADAKHTQSDLLVTASVLGSLIAAKFGIWLLDPIVAVLIAGLIGKAAYDIILESAMVLSDASIIDPKAIEKVVSEFPDVHLCHEIRTRGTQNHVLMDLRIHVEPDMTVLRSHDIADEIEARLMQNFPTVQEVVVHVEPHGAHHCPL
ncbi:MAG: cation diffusion facilitator family transporter [Leptospirillia bacterium]